MANNSAILEKAAELTQEGNLNGLMSEAMPKPSTRYFTPMYNDYIKAKGQSKMTKQEALNNWEFLAFGGKQKATEKIEAVVKAQEIAAAEAAKGGIKKTEAKQIAMNMYPLEALFKFLPM